MPTSTAMSTSSAAPTTTAARAVVALVAAVGLAACGGSGAVPTPSRPSTPAGTATPSSSASVTSTLLPDLDTYTDRGDGCAQAISAIGYADEVLRPLGQEPYQEFDDAVRSRLSGVSGTLALEMDDFPDDGVVTQAKTVQRFATQAGALVADDDRKAQQARIGALLHYRIEAAKLVLVCRTDVKSALPAQTGGASSTPKSVKLPSTPATEPPTIP